VVQSELVVVVDAPDQGPKTGPNWTRSLHSPTCSDQQRVSTDQH
jgi:hypothetical protein